MGRVLVVDDDADVREAIAEAVADAGYEVVAAQNGADALVRMREERPCIVLLDLMMPVMDGWQVVAAMEADPALADIRVCVVSAMASPRSAPRSACVLRKPVALDALLQTIETYCGKPPA